MGAVVKCLGSRTTYSIAAGSLALAALVGVFAPGDATAQAFNVREFSCATTDTGAEITVDIRGIGNTDVCVSGTITSNQNCACVSSSGSCPQATNKASLSTASNVSAVVEAKNGNVQGTVPVDLTVSETCGIAPTQCGSGQTPTLISHTTTGPIDACVNFTTDEDGNCVCGDVIATTTCSDSDVDFAGRRNSCIKLFQ